MGLGSVVRWVRAGSFSAACSVLASLGHLSGGGRVDRLALVAAFLLILVPALALTRRERTFATILPAVAVGQVALHVLFAQTVPGHAMVMPAADPAGHAGMETPAAHGGSSGLAMLLMHTVAVLVTSWWLERGEAWLCALARRVARWTLRPLTRVRPVPVDGPARPMRATRRPRAAVGAVIMRHVLVRRGPPQAPFALA